MTQCYGQCSCKSIVSQWLSEASVIFCLFTTLQFVSSYHQSSSTLMAWRHLLMIECFYNLLIVDIERLFPVSQHEVLPVSQITWNSVLIMASHVSYALSCRSVSEENESGISGFISEIKPFTNYFLSIRRPTMLHISLCIKHTHRTSATHKHRHISNLKRNCTWTVDNLWLCFFVSSTK